MPAPLLENQSAVPASQHDQARREPGALSAREALAKAAHDQMATLAYCSSYAGSTNYPAIALAERMSEIAYPSINTLMGVLPGLKAFVAAVLGGIGSIPGAVVGGLVIGLVRALSSAYVGERWTGAIVFAILIVILVFRPEGLLGRRTKEKV